MFSALSAESCLFGRITFLLMTAFEKAGETVLHFGTSEELLCVLLDLLYILRKKSKGRKMGSNRYLAGLLQEARCNY